MFASHEPDRSACLQTLIARLSHATSDSRSSRSGRGILLLGEAILSPRIRSLTIANLRSIGTAVRIDFPDDGPLVLLGENNAGKSNIARAIDMVFGERWPGTIALEDHDFHDRDSDGIAVTIHASIVDLPCPYACSGHVTHIRWIYDRQNPQPNGDAVNYTMSCSACNRTFMNRQARASLFSMNIEADRRLTYQLSYSSKFTLLSRLMHRFHERLVADPERKARLEDVFGSLVKEFSGVPEFMDFRALLAHTAADLGQNLNYRLDIDFSAYDPSNFFRSLRVHPSLGDDVRSFDELGTGQEQILALAFSLAYAKAFGQSDGLVLVVDEPESHLHPLAQQWLASRLNHLATDGLQVVVTTHSPHFVDLNRPENLVVVRKPDGGATEAIQLSRQKLVEHLISRGADPGRTSVDSVGAFYEAAATPELRGALFSRVCVLVEGPTEALALPQLLRQQGFDALRSGVAFVSAEGIGNIAKWARFYSALEIPTYCIFDTDSNKSGADAQVLLAKRRDLLAAIEVEGDRAESWGLSPEPLWVGPTYATMDPNFENAMSDMFGSPWDEAYLSAADVVGEQSKPLRARYAASNMKLNPESVGCATLTELAQALRILVGDSDESVNGEQVLGRLVDKHAGADHTLDEPPF